MHLPFYTSWMTPTGDAEMIAKGYWGEKTSTTIIKISHLRRNCLSKNVSKLKLHLQPWADQQGMIQWNLTASEKTRWYAKAKWV